MKEAILFYEVRTEDGRNFCDSPVCGGSEIVSIRRARSEARKLGFNRIEIAKAEKDGNSLARSTTRYNEIDRITIDFDASKFI